MIDNLATSATLHSVSSIRPRYGVVILALALGTKLSSDSLLLVQESMECSIEQSIQDDILRKGLRHRFCLAIKNVYGLLDLLTPAPNRPRRLLSL